LMRPHNISSVDLKMSLKTAFKPEIYSNLNESQINAIFGVIETKNMVSLIHGPPGTGKTQTIVSLMNVIQELELGEIKPNILLCAPSNGAIDELVYRVVTSGFINKNNVK